jgi:hypothetical protein
MSPLVLPEVLEAIAVAITNAWEAQSAAREARGRSVKTRTQAAELRCMAQREQARTKVLRAARKGEVATAPETPLEMARRHVAEGETRGARQAELLEQAIANGGSAIILNAALTTLRALEHVLDRTREDLRREES